MTATIFGAADRAYALVPATTQTANVLAAQNQLVPCDTTLSAFTVTLPSAPPDMTMVAVKLLAGTNTLTVVTSSGDVFDAPSGSTSQTLTIAGQGLVAQYSATAAVWFVSSDELPLADLDSRYVGAGAGATIWHNVKAAAYGAKGDGTTDDSIAINAAITAASAAGGIVYFPAGRYLCNGLAVTGSGVQLRGEGDDASILVRNGNGTLLSMSGPSSDPTGATHLTHCSIVDLQLNGNGGTGLLLQAYYASNLVFRNINFTNNADLAVQGVELWDSRFNNCQFVSITGAAGSTTQPAVWLRNSAAASGFGFSSDNVNQVHFVGCRWEACGTGCLWISQGTGNSSNPNKMFITDCKIECDQIQGGPALLTDNSTQAVFVAGLTVNIGGFASGYSTAQIAISFGGGGNALRDVYITNGSTATISNGVFLHAVGGTILVLDNVNGRYTTAPTGGHLFYDASATGGYFTQACTSNTGTLQAGTVPTTFIGGAGDVQTFTTAGSGTWVKPPGAVKTTILLIGGGGGGGSGAVEASGTVASGGAGGAGGAFTILEVPSALLSATEAVQVGAGGTGGTAVGTSAANGNAGGNGTNSFFRGGSFAIANWGNGGAGGTTGAATGGSGGGGSFNGGAGASSSATGAAGSNGTSTSQGAPGGGSGGGVTTGAAASAGGAGGTVSSSGGNAAGTAGTSGGGAGGAGTAITANYPIPGTGGGGGGSSTTGNGGAGGAGGRYGAGGGGGGAALTGHSSGAGGNGSSGLVVVVTT